MDEEGRLIEGEDGKGEREFGSGGGIKSDVLGGVWREKGG